MYAYKISWWCKRERVESLKTSCVGEVRINWNCGVVCVIEVFDNQGRLFWKQPYQGPNRLGRCSQDVVALKHAIKTGSAFSAAYSTSALWAVLIIFISLVVWFYKRSWRLERERLSRNDPEPKIGYGEIKFSSSQIARYKSEAKGSANSNQFWKKKECIR